MKTLYLLRHAKSSWDEPGLDDFERPLNHRGEKDAPKMGKRLRKAGVHLNQIVSSPARRAMATAKLVAGEMNISEKKVREEKGLYHVGPEDILAIVHSFSDAHESVMLVGHNPGLTEFADELLGEDLGNIPTAGIVGATLKITSWKEAAWGCGKMEMFEYPKKE